MSKLVVLCLCLCAATAVIEGKPKRRAEPLKTPRPFEPDSPEFDDLFFPGISWQCAVNGISLYEGAVWSPDPCSVCECRRGAVNCRPITCTETASAAQQTVSHTATKLTPSAEKRLEKTSKRKTHHSQPVNDKKVAVEEKKKKNKTPAIPVKTAEAPPTVTKKQVPAQKKKEEVTVKTKTSGGKVHLSKAKDGVVNQRVAVTDNRKIPQIVSRQRVDDDDDDSEDYLDDDSDYDDDDDNGNISFLKPTAPPVFITTGRPVVLPTRRSTVLAFEKPMVPPNKRPVVSPTGPLALPTGRPVVRANLRPTIHSARRTVFMESLPAGCLLSESLIACGSTGMTQIPIIRDAGVRTLYLADNKISKIPTHALAGLPNLEWLDLSKNKLDDSSLGLDLFQNLTKLRRLNLDGNNLTKVPALPSSLVELKINDNKLLGLTANSFKGLSNLLTLELEDNHFHDGNVSPLTFRPLRKLIYLRLDDNKFRAVPSGLPISLQELHLSDNRIEEVHAGPLNKTVNLRILDLSHNRIREDRIAPRAWIHLQKLESLDLSRNKLVHVPSFLPVGLRQLTLHHNQIERIPGYVFAHMRPGLDSLQLSYNRLHEDGINEVSFLGLYHSLSELLLDHNQLRAIPRGLLQLKTLQLLRLNNNYISYVPLNAICDTTVSEDSPLLSVHLENNLIDRRLIPPTAFSCIKTYHSVLLRPQRYEEHYE